MGSGSSKDMPQNTRGTFDWVSNAEKIYLGYYLLHILSKMDTTLKNQFSSSDTIRSLATIRTAKMYIFFFDFEVQVASRACHTVCQDRQFNFPARLANLHTTSLLL